MGSKDSKETKNVNKTPQKQPEPPPPPVMAIDDGMAIKWWGQYSTIEGSKKRMTKSASIKFLLEFSKLYGKKLDETEAESFYSKCTTTFGNLTEGQFQVLIFHISNHFKIKCSGNILPPYLPETVNHPRHNHPLKSIRKLDGHNCNTCGDEIGPVSYRCDQCDFDLCESCSSVEAADKAKEEVLEKLTQLKSNLIEVQHQNDLQSHFKIEGEITLELLNKQYSRLNIHSDKEEDVDGTFALRNLLRENYWARIEHKEELLQIYKKFITYRPLYGEIDIQGASILKIMYKSVGIIKTELEELLKSENQEPTRHILFQEVYAFYLCIEILLRFKDPQCDLLPKIQNINFDFNEEIIQFIITLEKTPRILRPLVVQKLLESENISATNKLFLLLYAMRDLSDEKEE